MARRTLVKESEEDADLAPSDAARDLYRLVKRRGEMAPETLALLEPGSRPLTYAQLVMQIEKVGRALRREGLRPGDAVAVVLPNGACMASAFLGVAAYTACAPLNPAYRDEELEFHLKDLAAKAVIVPDASECRATNAAERLGLKVVPLRRAEDGFAGRFGLGRQDTGCADFPVEPESPASDAVALFLHTSGTTARPKLVPLTHANLCASAQNIARVLRLSSADRCLNMMPLFHIHGLVGALCSSLAAGGSVICAPGYNEAGFGEWLAGFEPTWYSAVPTIHQSVLSLARRQPATAKAARFRLIRSSSSPLPPTVMRELEDVFRAPVIEAYGMTEAAHQMSSNPLPPAVQKAGSVGLPSGPEMAVMDDDGNLLPQGATGEVVIRGANVTAGYLGQPEANQAAFTGGWFRTGDMGSFDEEGYLFLRGRNKEMIDRGGENVSPREVDEVLLQHPAVEQAVAFAVPHPTLGQDVAAAVVLYSGASVTEHELRLFAFERLAPFKVPSRLVFVGSIPKGPSGKLQRIGLHQALEEHLSFRYVAPRNDLEGRIVAVIEQVLGADRVGVKDNFFALGGSSLSAARVLGELSLEYQVELPAVSLFLSPTAEELSLEITRRLSEDTDMIEEILAEIEALPDGETEREPG